MLKKNTSFEVSDRSRYWTVLVIKTAGSSKLVETASTEIDDSRSLNFGNAGASVAEIAGTLTWE